MDKAEKQLAKTKKLDSSAKLFRYSDGEFKIVTRSWTDFYNAKGICTGHLANRDPVIGDAELEMFGKDDADYMFFAGISDVGNK